MINKQRENPPPACETYDLSDPESWQRMHQPESDQEISAASYSALLLRVLEEHRGWIRNDEFLAIVEEIFGPIFSEADKRKVRGRPKWMNAVDWAKATLTSAGVIYTRSRQRKGKKADVYCAGIPCRAYELGGQQKTKVRIHQALPKVQGTPPAWRGRVRRPCKRWLRAQVPNSQ